MNHFEIEIKSLLGSKESADKLKRGLLEHFPKLKAMPLHKQLNHYFNVSPACRRVATNTNAAHTNKELEALAAVYKVIAPLLPKEKQKKLSHLISNVTGAVSIRTREADGKVLFIIKASIGDDSSANGVSRIEFECVIPPRRDCGTTNAAHPNKNRVKRPRTLDELDKLLLDAGLTYQAKWSRERESFEAGDLHIMIDKNAGYGYLAEFEKIVKDETRANPVREELLKIMEKLGCEELKQDRLERMFAHYNKHWEEYYGTERTFTIE